jgi:hypothetical protein
MRNNVRTIFLTTALQAQFLSQFSAQFQSQFQSLFLVFTKIINTQGKQKHRHPNSHIALLIEMLRIIRKP